LKIVQNLGSDIKFLKINKKLFDRSGQAGGCRLVAGSDRANFAQTPGATAHARRARA